MTFEDFMKARRTAEASCGPQELSTVDLLNAAMVASRKASSLPRRETETLFGYRKDLERLAAQGGSPPRPAVEAIVRGLKAMGLRVLDRPNVSPSDLIASPVTAQEDYKDYLEAQQMFKREYAQASRPTHGTPAAGDKATSSL